MQYRVSVGEKRLEREEIVDFLSKTFGKNYDDSRIVQGTVFDTEPSTSPGNFILARSEEGELIGMVRTVERNFLLDGAVLTAGCISSVGVQSEWSGQGIASDLMNTAIENMTSRGMDISILYGRRALDGFYPRFGYYGVGRYVDLEIISPFSPETSLDVVPFKEDNLEMCMELYNGTYGVLSGSVLRDRSIWEFFSARLKKGIGGFKTLICREGQDAIGYLVIFGDKLIETCLPPRVFADVPALLGSLGVKSISIHPRHPLYIYCRTRMNTIQKERFALDGGYMARILNPGSLLNKLMPAIVSRASAVGVSDNVIRLFDYECDLKSGRVSKTYGPNDIVFEKTETAVQFVLGVISPQDVAGVKWTGKKPWILYLFPELHYHTSACDEV